MTPIPGPTVSMPQARDEVSRQVQEAVKEAVNAARRAKAEAEQDARAAVAPGLPASQSVIDALRAELAAEKTAVNALTAQLEPGLSQAREDAITDQLDAARERVRTVQSQLDRALGVPEATALVVQPPPIPVEQIPELALPIVSVVMGTLAFMIVGWPIARAWARRMDRRNVAPAASPDMSPRFDRIEQAIEAMAIEIERVSEGQRFTTKLLSEVRALPSPNPLNEFQGARQRAGDVIERSEVKG
ncbi:MAG: hypothetical protein MNPFHGCM_01431 [Gemmatimonadaceae bacterium]|nr:hypothetical protein [Gemmatimonadaceae bacterium]